MVSAVSAFGMPGMYGAMGYPGLIADVMHDLALCHEIQVMKNQGIMKL